jgi:hypothetical protein
LIETRNSKVLKHLDCLFSCRVNSRSSLTCWPNLAVDESDLFLVLVRSKQRLVDSVGDLARSGLEIKRMKVMHPAFLHVGLVLLN